MASRLAGYIFVVAILLPWCESRAETQVDVSVQSKDYWTQALRSGELEARRLAAITLRTSEVDLQQQLLPVFIELLMSEKDGQIRLAVLDILTDMGAAAADAVPALVHAMRHDFGGRGDEERHQDFRAALALAHIGQPAVDVLRKLLSEDKENLRAEAAMALGRIGPLASPAIQELVGLFGDSSERVRSDAIKALTGIGEATFGPLITATQSETATIRAAAVETIGALKLQSSQTDVAFEAVKRLLEDNSPQVRASAVEAIANCGLTLQELAAAYLEMLEDSDRAVRIVAVNAVADRRELLNPMETQLSRLLLADDEGVAWHAAFLLQLQGVESVPILFNSLEDQRGRVDQIARALSLLGRGLVESLQSALDNPNPRVQQAAALALGQIRPLADETVAKLSERLTSQNRDSQAVYLKAIHSLGAQASPAVPAVRALANDSRAEIRRLVIDILLEAAPRDKQLLDELISRVHDSDPLVQQHALRALHASGPFGRPAIKAAADQLRSADTDVRIAAAEFIASHGKAAGEVVPLLIDMLHQGDTQWRVVIIETLGELGSAAQSALPSLSWLLQDPSAAIRSAAVQSLTNLQLSPQELQGQLVQALQDGETEVRAQALNGIRRFGRRGTLFLPDLIALAAHSKEEGSIQRALERFESYPVEPNCIPRLIELLQQDSPQVQRLAVQFLGLAGPAAKGALSQLQPLTQHADEKLRAAAAVAIKLIGEDT